MKKYQILCHIFFEISWDLLIWKVQIQTYCWGCLRKLQFWSTVCFCFNFFSRNLYVFMCHLHRNIWTLQKLNQARYYHCKVKSEKTEMTIFCQQLCYENIWLFLHMQALKNIKFVKDRFTTQIVLCFLTWIVSLLDHLFSQGIFPSSYVRLEKCTVENLGYEIFRYLSVSRQALSNVALCIKFSTCYFYLYILFTQQNTAWSYYSLRWCNNPWSYCSSAWMAGILEIFISGVSSEVFQIFDLVYDCK